jgi:DNA-binding MarR family transcriptional regulator
MITKVPDVPRLLERLENAGLINRVRDEKDRRHVTARISAKGLELVDQILSAGETEVEKRFSLLSEEQLRVLIDALDTIRAG